MNFLSRYKKILITLGFIASIFILAYIIYSIFLKPTISRPSKEPVGTTTPVIGFPEPGEGDGIIVTPKGETGLMTTEGKPIEEDQVNKVANGGITKVTKLNNVPSSNININQNGNDINYYNKNDNKFYTIDKNGQIKNLSDKKFFNVENVTWAPSQNKAILEYPDGANIIYNFETKKQITLPKHWEDFNFSPNGKEIIMKSMGLDPSNRWLTIANENGSKIRPIELLGETDDTVYTEWSPNNKIIAMYTEGVDFNRQEVFFIGKNNENFKSTIIEGRGFQPKWNPDGKKLVYSVYSSDNDLKPTLWMVNAEGESIGSARKKLNLNTWAEKCTYGSTNELYCAVPKTLERGAGMFPELSKGTVDRLYKINTRTGTKKLIAIPEGEYNMSNLVVSENNYNLYFTDEQTNSIHKIRLK